MDQRFDPDRIDLERVAALRAEFGLPAGGLVVGAVGRLVAGKGYGELFSAARAVRCRHPEVRILVVSSPDLDKATPSVRPSWPRRPATSASPAGATSGSCWPSWTCSCSHPGARACPARPSSRGHRPDLRARPGQRPAGRAGRAGLHPIPTKELL